MKFQSEHKLRCHAITACFTLAAEIPTGFHVAWRSFLLTQFHLPVVMSMMKHSWLQKSVNSLFHQQTPASRLFTATKHTFSDFHLPVRYTSAPAPLGFYSYLFTQCSSGYELHSGILHATYATLCRSCSIITLITYVLIPSLFSSRAEAVADTSRPASAKLGPRSILSPLSSCFSSAFSIINLRARLSQCIPITIFHSATRELRPRHSPGRWLVGRLESLSSSPESHVADACLQTSVKSHGNGRRLP